MNKKINKNFVFEWKVIRERGFINYILTKGIYLAIMMGFIYVINIVFSDNVNYIMVALIYVFIIIVAPIVSWVVNESRYNKYK